MCGPSGSSPPQSFSCCAMIRFGTLKEEVVGVTWKVGRERRKIVRMGKSPNCKRFRKKSRRTRQKRWKRRKNRCKRAHHPNVRFLEWWFPSISNGLLAVTLSSWNVLTVRERVRSLQSTVSSGSHRTSHAKCRPKFMASVGRLREKRTGTWLEDKCSPE